MSQFCRDCRSCQRSWGAENDVMGLELSQCSAVTIVDLVTGKERHPLCRNERDYGTQCGPDGKMWVSKSPTVREQLERSLAATVQ